MRFLATMGAVAGAVMVGTGAAVGQVPEPALDHCIAAVDWQIAAGIQPGGGPKSIDVAPINCDMFWFRTGVIGNENSGGPLTP
jgi:hypothetical protein